MLSTLVPSIFTVASIFGLLAIIYFYIQWLLNNQGDSRYYLAPLWILLLCLTLGGLSQSYIFSQAMITGYSTQTGWFSDTVHYEPQYAGENLPLAILGLGPFVGLVIMLLTLPHTQRKTQAIHFITLLLFVYPIAAITVLAQVGGDRPQLYDKETLPAIGTRMPTRP